MTAFVSHAARPFTYEDLEGMPDDGYRREIIGGSLIVTPAPVGRHQLAASRLLGVLQAAAPDATLPLVAPYDWKLPDAGSVQPDLIVVRRDDLDLDGPLPASARPLLVVEVLSPSNPEQDRAVKRALYESLGVPSYWMVDPVEPSIVALGLREGRYEVEATVAGSDAFETDRPFPVRVVPADLLR